MADHKCTQEKLIETNLSYIKEMLEKIEDNTNKIENRVTELEAVQNTQKGAMIAITGVYAVTIAIITIYLTAQGL